MNTTGYRPAEEFARQATCTICNGRELVCENHPGKVWPHECDCGAGMPCVCSPLHKHQPKKESNDMANFEFEIGELVCIDPTGKGRGISGKIVGRTEYIGGAVGYVVSAASVMQDGICRHHVDASEICRSDQG